MADQSPQATEQGRISVVVAEAPDDQISADLVWLTEHLMKTQGAETSGGALGGEYGYGAYFENDVFSMHPYCWCERDDCPWCWEACSCGEGAYTCVAGTIRKDESLACDYCRGKRVSAPNFLHKASGTSVHWYKYIGRGMEVDLRAEWRSVLRECVDSLPTFPPDSKGASNG